jgi:hypothetical protein
MSAWVPGSRFIGTRSSVTAVPEEGSTEASPTLTTQRSLQPKPQGRRIAFADELVSTPGLGQATLMEEQLQVSWEEEGRVGGI